MSLEIGLDVLHNLDFADADVSAKEGRLHMEWIMNDVPPRIVRNPPYRDTSTLLAS
jgi:hypothetical protein